MPCPADHSQRPGRYRPRLLWSSLTPPVKIFEPYARS